MKRISIKTLCGVVEDVDGDVNLRRPRFEVDRHGGADDDFKTERDAPSAPIARSYERPVKKRREGGPMRMLW